MVGAGLPIFRPSIGTQDGITPSVWVVYQQFSNSQFYARLYSLTVAGSTITITALAPAIGLGTTTTATITAVACATQDICYVATTDSADNTVRLYRVQNSTAAATVVYSAVRLDTSTQWNNSITQIWPYSYPTQVSTTPIYFTLYWDQAGSFNANVHGLWKSSDNGLTFNHVSKGYNDSGNFGIFTFALARGKRLYTNHQNTALPNNCIISYSDTDGATWTDIANTALNQFATGRYGFVSLSPLDSDTLRVWFSESNSGGGIMTSFMDSALNITLNPQFTGVLDSAFIDGHYYTNGSTPSELLNTNRFILHAADVTSYKSSDGGATWDSGAINLPASLKNRSTLYSVLPYTNWIIITATASPNLYISITAGIWTNQSIGLGVLDTIKGCTWVNGRI